MSFLREGIAIALRCLGSDFQETHQFLKGFSDGAVRLTGTQTEPGTQWAVHEIAPGAFTFECVGIGERRFLDGRTIECNVGLAPNTNAPFIGTGWKVIDLPDPGTHIKLQCLGTLGNCHEGFLDGRTAVNDGGVGLQPMDNDFSGTHWELLVWTANPSEIGGTDGGHDPR